MKYWWVSQNQTYNHEVPGGYMWSPKRQTNGNTNHSYELMKQICPKDMVFSFANQSIKAIGLAKSLCYDFPKPLEFGNAGSYWSDIGWRVDVHFIELHNQVRPADHMNVICPLLAEVHAPIQQNGHGNQAYLFQLSELFAKTLAQLIGPPAIDLVNATALFDLPLSDDSQVNTNDWEDRIESTILTDTSITETVKDSLVKSRRGQGKFRRDLLAIESSCRVTGVNEERHLRASHTKPWRDSNNAERLDPENGFMLTPTIDHLFDKGFISFKNNGDLIISNIAKEESILKMGISPAGLINVGGFTEKQKYYLEWHRDMLFK